jgi:superfamily II DNA or RNA helicase
MPKRAVARGPMVDKKRIKSENSGTQWQTVAALGAGPGTILRGLVPSDGLENVSDDAYKSVEGTAFRVVEGTIWALPQVQAAAREAYPVAEEDQWARKLARFQSTKSSEAHLRLGRYDPMVQEPLPALPTSLAGNLMGMISAYGVHVQNMCDVDGREVLLEVLSIGLKWSHLDLQIGQRATPTWLAHRLNAHFQDDEEKIGFLCLRSHLWVEGKRSGPVRGGTNGPVDEDVHGLLFANHEAHASALYDVEETTGPGGAMLRYRLPISAATPFMPEDAKAVFDEMTRGQSVHPGLWDLLAQPSVSFGALKSLMQKTARFRPKTVMLPIPDENGECEANAKMVMLAATLLCLSTKGNGYLPDLHMSVRGATAACKRLGVIAVEDSWFLNSTAHTPEDRSPSLRALFGLAMATMRMSNYHISAEVAKEVGKLAVHLVSSKQIIAWSPKFKRTHTGMVPTTPVHMLRAAELLRILKSFEGDMAMVELAAQVSADGQMPVIDMDLTHSNVMPIVHMIDQHVYRGIAHQVLDFKTSQPSANALGPRFQTLFREVTGFNPRLATTGEFDEARDPVPAVRAAQWQLAREVFATAYPKMELAADEYKVHTARVSVDPAILSQAVGPLKVCTCKTTAVQNLADVEGDAEKATKLPTEWKNLIVLLGTRSSAEVVVFAPSRDTKPKPDITARVKTMAIAEARRMASQGLAFKSRLLPFHDHAKWIDNGWVVTSTKPGVANVLWSWEDAMSISLPFVVSPWAEALLDDMPTGGMRAAARAIRTARLTTKHLTDAEDMVQVDDDELRRCLLLLVEAVVDVSTTQGFNPGNILSRLLSTITAQYVAFNVPIPGLQGGGNEKELKPERGDWIVYRALLRLAAVVPGAFQSSSPKKLAFVVNDARALKHVESVLRSLVRARDEQDVSENGTWETRRLKLLNVAVDSNDQTVHPFGFQKDLVTQMVDRDSGPNRTQGQFLSLEVGLGKTVTGMLYALEYLSSVSNHGIQRIVWITKEKIVDTTVGELQRWGQDPVGVKKVTCAAEVNRVGVNAPLTVLAVEALSASPITGPLFADHLLELAKTTLFIVDEVHLYYNLSDRASRLLQAVSACPKFLVMTATPASSTRQLLAREWLRRCVNFPVEDPNDVLVAGATFISGRYELGINSVEETRHVSLTEEAYGKHHNALSVTGGWGRAARVVRDSIEDRMANDSVNEALCDREANPNGGVLVVADNVDEANQMQNKMSAIVGGRFRVELRDPSLDSTQPTDGNVGIVVVTKGDVTGYNLQRLGAIITGVYAGNAAQRHQLRGRIRRLGQQREEVKYLTIVGRNTILELLFERHKSTDAQGATLEKMAALFVANHATEARRALGGM